MARVYPSQARRDMRKEIPKPFKSHNFVTPTQAAGLPGAHPVTSNLKPNKQFGDALA